MSVRVVGVLDLGLGDPLWWIVDLEIESEYPLQWPRTISSVPDGGRYGCGERYQTIVKSFMVHVRLKPRYLGNGRQGPVSPLSIFGNKAR
jgi:hypothetical protein